MQLDESYEIFELTQLDGVVVSKARDKKTGKLIQIHLFPNEKIPEASQICARLLSLPGEARAKVLKYGQDGSSTYFITEPLPEGEGLAEWVRRAAAPRSSARTPEVNGGAVGSLRQMEIEPAPLQPLPAGPASSWTSAEQAPQPNPAPPVAQTGSIVHPIPVATPPGEPAVHVEGEFTRIYSRAELGLPPQASPPPREAPVSSAPSPSPVGFTQIYGAQDWKMPEPAAGPGTLPEAAPPASASRAGLETFLGIPKAMRPPGSPPQAAPPQPAPPAAPPPAPGKPAFSAPPVPSRERFSSPSAASRTAGETFAFDPPPLPAPVRDQAGLFASPLSPPPVSPAPQSSVRPGATAPAPRRVSEPFFSGKVALAAALGLIAVAAVVVVLVEFLG
ncbi:MAG: hypothetical protein P4K98_14090 [Bryobacteraceae bacterium]|nr:hypothetical protein [Bryobacteraceae bacterium]